MKKRTKQLEIMIEEANKILKADKVIEASDSVFSTMQYLLLKIDSYGGYNYFYDRKYVDVVGRVTYVPSLCGTRDYEKLKEMKAYIQLY